MRRPATHTDKQPTTTTSAARQRQPAREHDPHTKTTGQTHTTPGPNTKHSKTADAPGMSDPNVKLGLTQT
jgi:hypothetical protein